jgi:hypothetical protein
MTVNDLFIDNNTISGHGVICPVNLIIENIIQVPGRAANPPY